MDLEEYPESEACTPSPCSNDVTIKKVCRLTFHYKATHRRSMTWMALCPARKRTSRPVCRRECHSWCSIVI